MGIAIPPPGLNWPEKYSDPSSFFFVDFVWGDFFHITHDPSHSCADCSPPISAYLNETFHHWPRPVGLQFGPYVDFSGTNKVVTTHALYYTVREGNINLRRVVYKGGSNYAPIVNFTTDKLNALAGESFSFNASSTLDPNHAAQELTYTWDFGDGSFAGNGVIVSHQYSAVGLYIVTLTATDPEGASGDNFQDISVGEQPKVEIFSPEEGATFAVGDVITLAGRGVDSDGHVLYKYGELTWEVQQHHNHHIHPFLPRKTPGNNISITEAPGPEDFFAATNSYLEIILTGTDQYGIPGTVSRKVMPRHVELDFDTDPTGLTLKLEDEAQTMPQRVLTWENHNLHVVAPDQGDYVFSGWANRGSQAQDDFLVVPAKSDTVPLYVAVFEKVADTVDSEDPGNTVTIDGTSGSISVLSSIVALLISSAVLRMASRFA